MFRTTHQSPSVTASLTREAMVSANISLSHKKKTMVFSHRLLYCVKLCSLYSHCVNGEASMAVAPSRPKPICLRGLPRSPAGASLPKKLSKRKNRWCSAIGFCIALWCVRSNAPRECRRRYASAGQAAKRASRPAYRSRLGLRKRDKE